MLWDIIVRIFVSCANKLYPMKKYKMWKNNPDWVDEEVVRTITKKKQMYMKAKSSGDLKDWDQFKAFKNKATKLLRRKRKSYVVKTLSDNRNDPKQFWKEIGKNLNVGKHKPKAECTTIEDDTGKVTVGQEASEVMNEYYINMGSNLAKKFNKTWEPTVFF